MYQYGFMNLSLKTGKTHPRSSQADGWLSLVRDAPGKWVPEELSENVLCLYLVDAYMGVYIELSTDDVCT